MALNEQPVLSPNPSLPPDLNNPGVNAAVRGVSAVITFFTTITAIFFLLFGSVFLYFGISEVIKSADLSLAGVTTSGQIINRNKETASDIKTVFQPSVEFAASNGQKYTFTPSITDQSMTEGKQVEVIYKTSDPQSARVGGFFNLWFFPLLLSVLGLIAVLAALSKFKNFKQKVAIITGKAPPVMPGLTSERIPVNSKSFKDASFFTFAIFLAAGVVFLGIFIVMTSNNINFLNKSSISKGIVVDFERQTSSKGKSSYYPVVEYKTLKGETVRFTENLSTSFSPQINSVVEVVYNSENPNEAKINSFAYLWFGPSILAFMAVIFISIGGISFFKKITKEQLKQKLRTTGIKASATVQSFESTSTSINHVRGQKVIVACTQNGNTITLKSDTIYRNDLTNTVKVGDTVDLYVNPSNPKEYFIDLESLRPGKASN